MALITVANLASMPIQEGDAGIILRKEGGFQLFNTHADIDPENMTDVQIEQAETLQAFAVALQIPQIMDILKAMSMDPKIVGEEPLELDLTH